MTKMDKEKKRIIQKFLDMGLCYGDIANKLSVSPRCVAYVARVRK